MLVVPRYIQEAGTAPRELPYAWDEWAFRDYYMPVRKPELERLEALTNSANLGLTLAIGEWVAARFAPLHKETMPGQVLEAGWAAMIRPEYCIYVETEDDHWQGPVLGPLAVVINVTNDAIFCLDEDPRVAVRACWMHNLARHVLPAGGPFEAWLEACIVRMEAHHAQARLEPVEQDAWADGPDNGPPVPREAFDPRFPYDPSRNAGLLDQFLKGLRPGENPYLRSADELTDVEALAGRPYTYQG